ncbi:MAG: hypothetical protein ACRDZM_04695 [Acidimicrobiia bacterium]
MGTHTIHHQSIARRRLTGSVIAAIGLSLAVIVSAQRDNSSLGVPSLWPWLLTGLQVLALWSAGRARWWGWLLGGSVQLPWVAYALMTDQIGFIPGCAVSASVQLFTFLRSTPQRQPMEATT